MTWAPGEDRIVHVGRGRQDAVNGRPELDPLGFGHVVVRFLLVHFVQIADDERPRIADAPPAHEADVIGSRRDVRIHGHAELVGRGVRPGPPP